jgi:DNA-binding NtrC family response regulator
MDERSYLLVFAADAAHLVPLPAEGEVGLCRGPGGLETGERAVLARVAAARGEHTVMPVPGAPPPTLNDAPLSAPARLTSGDVLGVGDLRAVFHRDPRHRPSRRVLEGAAFGERLRQEVDRSRRYGRPLAVLAVSLPTRADDEIAARALDAVRLSDVVGFTGPAELVAAFPEAADSAEIPARRVLAAMPRGARGGLALLPGDGDDADALLTGARRAAEAAAPGQVARLSADRLTVGETEVLALDPKMRGLLAFARDLAQSDLPILVTGETGAGKDVVARAIHAWSARSARRFVAFNCAALPESLVESELFGHRQGAFSGATENRPGLLESAAGGTVFLDEVGECSPRTQAELLRVLDSGAVRAVGAVVERRIDLRIVAATNRDLEEEVAAGRFRRDLFYRLGAARVVVPPLRERPLDVPALARHFLAEATAAQGRPTPLLSTEVLARLGAHDWPGNVRELRNLMRYVAAVVRGPVVELSHLPEVISEGAAPWRERRGAGGPFRPIADEIRDLERMRMAQALAACDGVRVKAAALIGMPLRTFATKLKQYRLDDAEQAP